MINKYIQQALTLYEETDAILITDKYGNIEYNMMLSVESGTLESLDVTGKNILELYPELNDETSTIMKVLRTQVPVIDEIQVLTTYNGRTINVINSTFPIIMNEEIIGTINASKFLDRIRADADKRSHVPKVYYNVDDIVTNDHVLNELKDNIKRIAINNSNVLITGETGTGKELVAQSIHSHSKRSNGPFVSQNCAAIPNTLLESMLFGTAKGSFTGAENRKGLFEIANNGTLFLDEINSMDLSIQSKILKVLEDKKIKRLGENSYIDVNVRIVSAMNRDPLKAIERKEIRRDLFYRICVVQINIPPLRDRKEDIELLVEHFIDNFNLEMNRSITGISELVGNLFQKHNWPGNVRELRNIIEAAFNISQTNIITMSDIPRFILKDNIQMKGIEYKIGNEPLASQVEKFEIMLIRNAIDKCDTMMDVANELNISRQSLQYKLTKYNLN